MNANFRIGFNLGGLLKNLGVFVVKVSQEDGERIIMVCDQLRVALHLKEAVHTGIVELVADPRARFGGRVLRRSTPEYLGSLKSWTMPQPRKST